MPEAQQLAADREAYLASERLAKQLEEESAHLQSPGFWSNSGVSEQYHQYTVYSAAAPRSLTAPPLSPSGLPRTWAVVPLSPSSHPLLPFTPRRPGHS